MSLRTRLTLLFVSIVGGILLLFSVAVYLAVSLTITRQLDDGLRQAAEKVIASLDVSMEGGLQPSQELSSLDLPAEMLVQVWGTGNDLRDAIPSVINEGVTRPLDPVGLQSTQPVFRDVALGETRLRVLTVPLEISQRIVGSLQVGVHMDSVLSIQRALLLVLLAGTLLAASTAGLVGYFSMRQAFLPLGSVTQVALQITRADDLSRRIPYHGPLEDEVGQLVTAFNQTLGRLENLFHTQRRFLTDVGHELRTPLTVIKGNVGLMRRIKDFDEEALSSIEEESDRMTRLVGDLLLLAQAESGKIPMARQTVELDTLLLDVMNQMSVLARGKQQLRLGSIDQVLVCGDSDRLKQVIVNLVNNAINYTPAGGEVTVGLGKSGLQARLTVSDTGAGIPAEDLPHIFERFYRSEKSRTRQKEKGFGLGLSIAYWIVRAHGGRIEVSSTVGKGTVFCVWLPLLQEQCGEE